MEQVRIGIIGGSGLYQMKELTDQHTVAIDTPFGKPSDDFLIGTLGGKRVAFLPRHGRGHRLTPTELPYRANIHAFRQLGVEYLISVSAVGSMREAIAPGHICLPDQFIDLTKGRPQTFFGGGIVGHLPLADPVCAGLADVLHRAGKKAGAVMHRGGTYVCIEGPQFSTRAESNLYRSWEVDVIGMTNMPEARLAREAELCYATLALATDYDCWHEAEEVSVEQILRIINQNVALAQEIIRRAVDGLPEARSCACGRALEHAVITDRAAVPPETLERLQLLLGKYWR
jgi:5'-methylthioadenosine phosphorylase